MLPCNACPDVQSIQQEVFNHDLLTCREMIFAFCGDLWPNQELHSLDMDPGTQVCYAVMHSILSCLA